jgi:hypothetical protein
VPHVQSLIRDCKQVINDDVDKAYEELKVLIQKDIEAAQKAAVAP